MKRKFILGLMAVLLVMALIAVAMPVMSPETDGGLAGVSAAAGTTDLVALESQATFIVENVPVAAATAGDTLPWLALGASLLTLAVVYGRRSIQKFYERAIGLRSFNDVINEGAEKGGGPNKFILPAAA